ncbi:MAG: inositol monophosphatase [Firmicutes bacterium]|jgi:myo-inositol-1(or 4)-monophosphatase|nr:inositol monophosphatase [Bacillota bacterium]
MSIQRRVEEIIRGAGDILLEKLASGFTIEHKGRVDLVTDADRAAEAYITKELQRDFPAFSILGEEEGLSGRPDAEYLWLIDPLDGTTNFAHGFPYFSVSIALTHHREVVFGAVYDPSTKTLFTAGKDQGAFMNGEPISVSEITNLENSLLVTGFPYDVSTTKDDNIAEYAKALKATQGVLRTGSAALDLCNVACGRLDAYWEKGIDAYDIAAGSLIVTEAGGRLSAVDGGPFDLYDHQVLASNGLIHDELVQLIGTSA